LTKNSVETFSEWKTVSAGRLLATTAALVFEGNDGNHRLLWDEISDVSVMPDGIKVHVRSGSPLVFKFSTRARFRG
jgi:hypothetical protein